MDELTYHACPFLAYAVKLDLGRKGQVISHSIDKGERKFVLWLLIFTQYNTRGLLLSKNA